MGREKLCNSQAFRHLRSGAEICKLAQYIALFQLSISLVDLVELDMTGYQVIEFCNDFGQRRLSLRRSRRIGRYRRSRKPRPYCRQLPCTAPAPVMTPQPASAARSSGISAPIFTTAFSWTSICSAKVERLKHRTTGLPLRNNRCAFPGGILTEVLSQRLGRPVMQ